MSKIYCELPQNALFYGLQEPIAKGTQVFSPKNHFGVAVQNGQLLTVFTDSVTIDKKSIPNLQAPVFGKVQGLALYFYPYGFSGKFSKADYVFGVKGGKKVKISLSVKYEVQMENANKVLALNEAQGLYSPNTDGSLTRPAYFAKALTEYIVSKCDSPLAEMTPTADWKTPYTQSDGKAPHHAYMMSLKGMAALSNFFENAGYKVVNHDVKITAVELLG